MAINGMDLLANIPDALPSPALAQLVRDLLCCDVLIRY
jgi:hypothetical protein